MTIRSIAVALPTITASAFAVSPEDALRGLREARGGEMILRFAEDGTFTASAPRGQTTGQHRSRRWKAADGVRGHLRTLRRLGISRRPHVLARESWV